MAHGIFWGFALKNFIGQFAPFILYGLLMWQDTGKVDYGFVVRCLAVCTMTMCLTLLSMVLVKSNFDISYAFMNMQRLGMAAEENAADTLHINPNSLGVMCVLSVTGLLQMLTTGQGRLTDIVMALTMVICGALTTSRTFLALLLIMVVLFWLSQEGGVLKKLRFLLLITAVGALVFTVLILVFPVVIENFLYRLSVADLSSGRNDLLHAYNRFLYSHPDVLLLGVGLMDVGQKMTAQYSVAANVPHNGIQEMIVIWGILGLAMFLTLLGFMLWKGKKVAGKQRLLNYIPLILLIAKIQVGQMLTSYYTMLAFAFCYLSLAHNFEPNQQTHPVKRKFYKKTLDN
jgi:O-antigen ligase